MEFVHVPIMLSECIEGLSIKPDGTYIDATMGARDIPLKLQKGLTQED
jgi:16S rRNA (cytosine1402-N4)-methyltransferase